MNKKIKVIEFLNLLYEDKIKNGTKIKYYGTTYEIDFPNLAGIYEIESNVKNKNTSLFAKFDICALNYEIEILEDEEEIEEIEKMDPTKNYFKDGTDLVYKLMYSKINELVVKVNELEKNKVDYIQPYKEE